MLLYSKPWNRQPQGLVRPSSDYADMQVGWMATTGHHNIGGLPDWTKEGSPSGVITPAGRAEFSSAYTANDRYTGISTNPFTENWPGFTVVANLKLNTIGAGTYPLIISWLPVGEYYGGYGLNIESNKIGIYAGDSSVALFGPTVSSGQTVTAVAGWDKSTLWLWTNIDGVVSYASKAHVFGWRNLNSLHAVMGMFRSTYRCLVHPLALAAAVPRDIGQRAGLGLVLNPWQLFEPRRIWVPQTAGGTNTYTFSVSGGTTLSGTSPLIRERIQTPSGGFSLSGAPVISHERAIQASGQVTFSGSAPIVTTASHQLTPSGGVVFSGAPEISKEKIIPADGGVNFGGSSRLIFVPVGGVGTNDSDRISVGVSRKVGVS